MPVVFLSLPNPQIVMDVVLGRTGRSGRANDCKCAWICRLPDPKPPMKLAAGLAERNIASLEAPVSGGIKGAREGTLSLMVSGPQPAWEQVRPLLEIFGKPFFMGETAGAGQTMKLVNNLLGACAIAITAEGMTLGAKAGLDPARMIEVLNVSSGRSSATQDKWPRAVLPRTFDFGFASGLCLKDVRLCLAAARSPWACRSASAPRSASCCSARSVPWARTRTSPRWPRSSNPTPDWIRSVPLEPNSFLGEVDMSSELFDKG